MGAGGVGGALERAEASSRSLIHAPPRPAAPRHRALSAQNPNRWSNPAGRAGSCELMIGCVARAASHDITVDPEEMEEVRWVSRAGAWPRAVLRAIGYAARRERSLRMLHQRCHASGCGMPECSVARRTTRLTLFPPPPSPMIPRNRAPTRV